MKRELMRNLRERIKILLYPLEDEVFHVIYNEMHPKRQEVYDNEAFDIPWSDVHLVIQDRIDNSAFWDVREQLLEEFGLSSSSDL